MRDKRPARQSKRPYAYVVYWIRGDGGGMTSAVKDPPCSGFQHALLKSGPGGKMRVLCPVYLKVWTVPADCDELLTGYEDEEQASTVRVLAGLAEPRLGLGGSSDSAGVAEFLRAAGMDEEASLWEREARADARREEDAHSKDARVNASVSGVRPGSRKAEVLEFFVSRGGSGDLREAEKELGMSRNGVLTHLWGLRKKHGVTYVLESGSATVTLPDQEGHHE